MNGEEPAKSLLLVIGIVVTLLLIVVLRKRKSAGKTGETDYKAFFIMGIAFLPTGLAMIIMYFLARADKCPKSVIKYAFGKK